MKRYSKHIRILFLITGFAVISIRAGLVYLSPDLIPEKAEVTLKVGGTHAEVKFNLDDTSGSNPATGVSCGAENSSDADYFTIENVSQDGQPTVIYLKAKDKAKESISLICTEKASQATSKINLKILPEVEKTSLMVVGLTESEVLNSFNLLAGQSIKLKVDPKVELKIDPKETDPPFSIEGSVGGPFTLKGKKRGDSVRLIAMNSGTEIPINESGFTISVGAVSVQSVLNIRKGDKDITFEGPGKTVSFDPPTFTPKISLTYAAQNGGVEIDGNKLTPAEGFSQTLIKISSNEGASFEEKQFTASLIAAPKLIRIAPLDDNSVYLDSGKLLINAQVFNDDGKPANPQPVISWSIPDTDKRYVSVPTSGGSIQIGALAVPSDPDKSIVLTASIPGADLQPPIQESVAIFVRGKRNVVDFKPVSVRIDMLDQRTASDLFGKVASKEYHIAKIRIVNDMPSNVGGGASSSIIFFSDALEVRVALEKQIVKRRSGGTKGWNAINLDDVYYINNWDKCSATTDRISLEGVQTSTGYEACEIAYNKAVINCDISKAESKESSDLKNSRHALCVENAKGQKLICRQRISEFVSKGACDDDDFDCLNRVQFCRENAGINQDNQTTFSSDSSSIRNGQWIPFRPFVYQVIANTHDRRDERSVRSRIFLGANILGAGTSFITSFLALGNSSDVPLFLDKYQNLALPSFEKLFPSMREVQRQNIISEILPPLVEVPFGSDVSKYVFFPKKPIEGVLPNHVVRITSISAYNIKVKVGVVQKGNVTQTTR